MSYLITFPTASNRWLEDAMLIGVEVASPGSIDGVKGIPVIVTVGASCYNCFMSYPASMKAMGNYKRWPAEVSIYVSNLYISWFLNVLHGR